MGATWYINGSSGVTTSATPHFARQWSYYGGFGLTKSFGRSSLALNYSRGSTLASGLISSQYADRIDLVFRDQLTRRFSWGAGGGYLRLVQTTSSTGWYAVSNAQFLLAPRTGILSTFNYYHTQQTINVNNLFSGKMDTYTFGILWAPGRVPH
jgi:hypothetical protein